MTRDEIIAMANTAAVQHGHTYEPEAADGTIEFLGSFAALVAAQERRHLFGAGRQFDGQMRLQLTRWEDGECFSAAAHFSAEQTHCGEDDLLTNSVERLDDSLDACIAAAIRARDQKVGA